MRFFALLMTCELFKSFHSPQFTEALTHEFNSSLLLNWFLQK
jgi:hypothetical protein